MWCDETGTETAFGTYNVRDADGETTNAELLIIRPHRVKPLGSPYWEVVNAPITLAGYTLKGHFTPTPTGEIVGALNITASVLWGPDEWPA